MTGDEDCAVRCVICRGCAAQVLALQHEQRALLRRGCAPRAGLSNGRATHATWIGSEVGEAVQCVREFLVPPSYRQSDTFVSPALHETTRIAWPERGLCLRRGGRLDTSEGGALPAEVRSRDAQLPEPARRFGKEEKRRHRKSSSHCIHFFSMPKCYHVEI